MEIILIILCILFISCNTEIKGNYPGYIKFRNYALRVLISEDYYKLNRVLDQLMIKTAKY